ncbi:MAG TPA: hypothetical protein VI112_15675 [Bacteroidia bacterium]|jgi:hypothetical protein
MKRILFAVFALLTFSLLPRAAGAQTCGPGGYGCPGYGFHPHHGHYGPMVAPPPPRPVKVWVRGHWAMGRYGRMRWIPAHWEWM